MTCKYFYEDTDICAVSASQHFAVWFQPNPDLDYRGLDDLGHSTRVYRSIGSFIKGQYDVCPLQGESDGITTECPLYKER